MPRSVGMIVAVSPEGVIGVDGKIPWHYSGDMKRFKRLTTDKTVVMGRNTWDSLPKKPLPNRRNVVVTSRALEGAETFPSLTAALESCEGETWLIGGARIYEEGLECCDFIDVTYVPDRIEAKNAVKFPLIDQNRWEAGPLLQHEDEPALRRRVYTRKK